MITIRPYESRDTGIIIDLWAAALPLDAISLPVFERKVLLDANREPDSLVLAEVDGRPAGLALRLILHKPIEQVGLRPEDGFITAFGVHPEFRKRGVGGALMENSLEFFKKRDRKKILVAPYTPNYFVPGIDKDAYADGVRFFQKAGFVEYMEAIAMDAPISKFEIDPGVLKKEAQLKAEGIDVRAFRREDILDYLNFQATLMPGPWLEDARRNLVDFTRGMFQEDCIFLAVDKGRVIGFCQYEGDHFGPFGVSDDYQGKGIGSVLLAKTLYQMRIKGYHCAWVLWTGMRAAQGVYGRLGFTITRRMAIMKKELC
ncbi:MAG TPA: GNAT family N-acetyltransferase [Candidatus Sumerlaeota bacterium]|nr:GNAT family N-acetyltransferase [Candidatus Sumerlaeota bacterium]